MLFQLSRISNSCYGANAGPGTVFARAARDLARFGRARDPPPPEFIRAGRVPVRAWHYAQQQRGARRLHTFDRQLSFLDLHPTRVHIHTREC